MLSNNASKNRGIPEKYSSAIGKNSLSVRKNRQRDFAKTLCLIYCRFLGTFSQARPFPVAGLAKLVRRLDKQMRLFKFQRFGQLGS